ncbi:hypothetical protein DLAC_01871 [Tieghemostelium lacteum]|uniref:Uncharacterized protein n=1 Tax=Tieghemostelium lacteum TaxID=361077 RepID=A0A152A6J5_TIELA|nr:hypothetical protein DLAC_01871 [Tieghemostelium lacteum]|eukprot:KYR01854.1 hypothetical protein DLAC_01871 [Tieghemostelium lacteum]
MTVAVNASNGDSASGYTASPLFNTTQDRINLIPLKKQLDSILKEHTDTYWDYIKKFFQGKLSKRELDHYVSTFLQDHNKINNLVFHHNALFKAILQNSLYSRSAPSVSEYIKVGSKRKSLSSSSNGKGDKKDKSKKKDDKSYLKSSHKKLKSKKSSSLSVSTNRFKQKKQNFPKYSLYSNSTQYLKSKMEDIALESGITSISVQSVIYMKFALEQHLSNILKKLRPNHQYSADKDDQQQQQQQQKKQLEISQLYQYQLPSQQASVEISTTTQVTTIDNQPNGHLNVNNNSNSGSKENDTLINCDMVIDSKEQPKPDQQQQNIELNNHDIPVKNIQISLSDIFNSSTLRKPMDIQYPNNKYQVSNNPLMSFSTSFYQIPQNIFKPSPVTSIITNQDLNIGREGLGTNIYF